MTTKFIVVIALAAAAQSSVLPALEQTDDDITNFEYRIADPSTGDFKSQEESRIGDTVRGQYSVLQPDGKNRIVHYTAGDEGFNAVVINKPTAVNAISEVPGLIADGPRLIDDKPTAYTVPELSLYAQVPNYFEESNAYLPPPVFDIPASGISTTQVNSSVPSSEVPIPELKYAELPYPQDFGLKQEDQSVYGVSHGIYPTSILADGPSSLSISNTSPFLAQNPIVTAEAPELVSYPPNFITNSQASFGEVPARAIVNSYSLTFETPSKPSAFLSKSPPFIAHPSFQNNEPTLIEDLSRSITKSSSLHTQNPVLYKGPTTSSDFAKSTTLFEVPHVSAFFPKNSAFAVSANPTIVDKNSAAAAPFATASFIAKTPALYEDRFAQGHHSRAPNVLTQESIIGSTNFVSSSAVPTSYVNGPSGISSIVETPALLGTPTYGTPFLYSQPTFLTSPSFFQSLCKTASPAQLLYSPRGASPFSYGGAINSYPGWKK